MRHSLLQYIYFFLSDRLLRNIYISTSDCIPISIRQCGVSWGRLLSGRLARTSNLGPAHFIYNAAPPQAGIWRPCIAPQCSLPALPQLWRPALVPLPPPASEPPPLLGRPALVQLPPPASEPPPLLGRPALVQLPPPASEPPPLLGRPALVPPPASGPLPLLGRSSLVPGSTGHDQVFS